MFEKAIEILESQKTRENLSEIEDAVDALDNLANYCTDGVDMEIIYEILNDQVPFYYEVYEEVQEYGS